ETTTPLSSAAADASHRPGGRPALRTEDRTSPASGSDKTIRTPGMKRKTKLQTNTINSVSLKTISASPPVIDDSDTIIGTSSAIKPLNDTTFSVRQMTIDATPKIISGPETLIFIPRTIIGETPAIISGSKILISVSQILISGRPVESKNQQVADLPHGDTYLHDGDTYLRRGNKYRKDATGHWQKRDGYFHYGHDHVPAADHYRYTLRSYVHRGYEYFRAGE